MKQIVIIILIATSQSAILENQNECTFFKYCDMSFQCQGFETFDQLVMEPCLTNFSLVWQHIKFSKLDIIRIDLLPSSDHIILDNKLDLKSFQLIASDIYNKDFRVQLSIYNLQGINIDTDFQLLDLAQLRYVEFKFSVLAFYSSGKQVSCNRSEISRLMQSLGQKMSNGLKFEQVKFPSLLCPQMFQGVHLDYIEFQKMYPRFESISVNRSFDIHIRTLKFISLQESKLVLDSSILDFHMYGRTKHIDIIDCSLFKILPADLFKNLTSLERFELVIYNLKGFLHNMNGLEWTKYMNHHFIKHHGLFKIGMNSPTSK